MVLYVEIFNYDAQSLQESRDAWHGVELGVLCHCSSRHPKFLMIKIWTIDSSMQSWIIEKPKVNQRAKVICLGVAKVS